MSTQFKIYQNQENRKFYIATIYYSLDGRPTEDTIKSSEFEIKNFLSFEYKDYFPLYFERIEEAENYISELKQKNELKKPKLIKEI